MGITQQIGASSLIKPGVVDNTANRPASPYEGQVIFQKDTDQLLVWNGTAWVIPNSPAQDPPGMGLITSGTKSGANSYSFDGVFTSTYQNYKIVIDQINVATAGNAIRFQFRTSGSTISTYNYNYAYRGKLASGTDNDTYYSNLNYAEVGVYLSANNVELGSFTADIFNPQLAKRTRALVAAQGYEGSTAYRNGGFEFYNANQFDGFSLSAGSGNVSFTYAIYGYRS